MGSVQHLLSLLLAFTLGSVVGFLALGHSGDIMSILVHRDMVNDTIMDSGNDVRTLHPGEDSHMHNGRSYQGLYLYWRQNICAYVFCITSVIVINAT